MRGTGYPGKATAFATLLGLQHDLQLANSSELAQIWKDYEQVRAAGMEVSA